jgi:hypothetical protein
MVEHIIHGLAALRSPLRHGVTVSMLSFPTHLHVQMSPFPPQRLLLTQPPAGPLYRIRPSPHMAAAAARLPDIRGPLSSPTPQGHFPAAKGSSGHGLFISAFMLASKIICDDTYFKSWCILVSQGMFALREINQMEQEMCSYLEW